MLTFFRPRFDLAVTAGCLALLGYFAWHATQGPRGFAYKDGLEAKLASLQAANAEILSKRQALEARVALMRPDHVDPDMLEELARKELNMAAANDLVLKQ